VTVRVEGSRVAILNQLLGESGSWNSLRSALADVCNVFGLRAAGVRWPAEGAAVLVTETASTSRPGFQARFAVPQMAEGLFWADRAATGDDEFLHLLANVIGRSPLFRQALGPVAEQAQVAQRLEDVARVAGRVAHDLDNVFQGVTGFAELAMESLPSGSAATANIREVENSARQGLKFCAQLHQLSRGGHARPLPSSVSGAVNREVTRLQSVFPSVRFEVDAVATLPPAAVDGGALQTILGLLLENAAEASPKGGAVKVTARLIEIAPGDLSGFLGAPATGPHVEVRIVDAGPGLTDEAKRRMFVEPFFTTKFRHRGLSLAVVFRMLYAHRGGVQAEGQPGRGTTIRVVFPLAAARVPAVEPGRTSGGFAT
jgi:signal transduction histidine kinase